jgi:hypothetical protein
MLSPPPPPCRHHHHRSSTPSTPPPPIRDPAPLGHREELREPPSVKPPSGNHLHTGCHLRPPSAPGFATTGSAVAPRTSMSSPVPHYRRCRPPAESCHRGEPFLVSFRFPQPRPAPPTTGPHRRQPLQQSIGMLIRIKAARW